MRSQKLRMEARREAAAAQAAERRHAGIVPAGDEMLLDELAQLALAHDCVVDAEAGKLDLARTGTGTETLFTTQS